VSFPNRLVGDESIGTDRARAQAVDVALVRALGRTAYVRHLEARATGGYVAPILSGVWATAPYLHNGSVPTLWQLLTPEARPVRFTVGGHRLDFTTVGLAGAVGADGVFRDSSTYAPWSRPEIVDTRSPGMGNGGHAREVAGLTADDKRQLLEYLKGFVAARPDGARMGHAVPARLRVGRDRHAEARRAEAAPSAGAPGLGGRARAEDEAEPAPRGHAERLRERGAGLRIVGEHRHRRHARPAAVTASHAR
jgi:hypothetical protein